MFSLEVCFRKKLIYLNLKCLSFNFRELRSNYGEALLSDWIGASLLLQKGPSVGRVTVSEMKPCGWRDMRRTRHPTWDAAG